MPANPDSSRRYPKRQLKSVVYSETVGSHEELDEDSNTAAVVAHSDLVTIDDGGSSESDEDWNSERKKRSQEPKAKKPRIKKPKPFPFMKLPPELRNAVYHLVVGSPDGVIPLGPSNLTNPRLRRNLEEVDKPVSGWPNLFHRRGFRNLRLLRVSKDIYAEAAVVMYTKQKFTFSRLSALQTFLLLLRPETLDRITHIRVDVREAEWTFMPSVSSQLLQLHYLQTLQISGLGYSTSGRNFNKYLLMTERAEAAWSNTEESYDKLRSIKLARDLYPFMYPFFTGVIRAESSMANEILLEESQDAESASGDLPTPAQSEDTDPNSMPTPDDHTNYKEDSPYKRLVGIDALAKVLEFDHNGPASDGWYRQFLHSSALNKFEAYPMNDQRRETRRTAFKEELLSLMDRDSF